MSSRSSIRRSKINRESGYVLLGLMLAVTLMLIAMSIAAPRIAQQIKRQKEEELVHRGEDYATAVKRFVHKSGGQFPATLEQLEDTNHIRFLRKRYKDPITGEADWKLVHYGEAQIKIPATNGTPGLNTTNPGLSGSTNQPSPGGTSSGFGGGTGISSNSGTSFGGSSGLSSGGGGLSGGTTFGNNQDNSGLSGGTPLSAGGTTGLAGGSQSLGGAPQPGTNGQMGSLAVSGIGGAQSAGGGPIIGVASVSKKEGIKEFNDKDHYNDWLFVYDMRLEQSGGTGVTVAEPMAPGSASTGTGATAPTPPNGQSGATTTPGQPASPVPSPPPD
jgi:type II secretory pathway pseudopilin PulG